MKLPAVRCSLITVTVPRFTSRLGFSDNKERPIYFTGVPVIFVVPFDYMLPERQFYEVHLGWLYRHQSAQTRCPAICVVYGCEGYLPTDCR